MATAKSQSHAPTLRLWRNLLLRTVLIAWVFALLLTAATFGLWDWWMPLMVQWFHTDAAIIAAMVKEFFVHLRFYLVFVLLAPALALHWTLKADSD